MTAAGLEPTATLLVNELSIIYQNWPNDWVVVGTYLYGATDCLFLSCYRNFLLNGRVFVYKLSGYGFEYRCSHLTFRCRVCFEQDNTLPNTVLWNTYTKFPFGGLSFEFRNISISNHTVSSPIRATFSNFLVFCRFIWRTL